MNEYMRFSRRIKPDLELGRLAKEAGITAEERPAGLPDRPGYRWAPYLNTAAGSIAWREVSDPTAQGTMDNPILWVSGMSVKANYCYTHSGVLYVCIQSGAPETLDGEYFERWGD